MGFGGGTPVSFGSSTPATVEFLANGFFTGSTVVSNVVKNEIARMPARMQKLSVLVGAQRAPGTLGGLGDRTHAPRVPGAAGDLRPPWHQVQEVMQNRISSLDPIVLDDKSAGETSLRKNIHTSGSSSIWGHHARRTDVRCTAGS